MPTSYPSNIDNFANPTATDTLDSATVPHASQHANINDAVEAIETALGANLANVVLPARTISTTAPLSGGGNLSANRTLTIADATTSVKGAVQLSDSTSTTSSVLAATPTAVKSAYDAAIASVQTSFTISTTAPLSGGGNLSANRTFAIDESSDQLLLASQVFG
ncbi:MAG: hypothetical protein EBU08_12035 [Micrococcales bacterium]|nr:hypothetical protein [Micrococcales bacterium]